MKIWHDNSGRENKASWFLKFIIVKDLQTREKFYFICQKWLAVEKGDGLIERELFVASECHKKDLSYLMKTQSRHYLMDNHLWLSVFYRPIQSSFSRLDRVTCCFMFHYLSMCLNIVCYGVLSMGSANYNDKSNKIDFYLFSVSIQQVDCKISFF
jgi:polycystin 1L2